jgi:hypothetical protein
MACLVTTAPAFWASASMLIPAILRAEFNRSPKLLIMAFPPLVDSYHSFLVFVNQKGDYS